MRKIVEIGKTDIYDICSRFVCSRQPICCVSLNKLGDLDRRTVYLKAVASSSSVVCTIQYIDAINGTEVVVAHLRKNVHPSASVVEVLQVSIIHTTADCQKASGAVRYERGWC